MNSHVKMASLSFDQARKHLERSYGQLGIQATGQEQSHAKHAVLIVINFLYPIQQGSVQQQSPVDASHILHGILVPILTSVHLHLRVADG